MSLPAAGGARQGVAADVKCRRCIGVISSASALRPHVAYGERFLAVGDKSVVSSGIYERYIKAEDGTLYHHILNPQTGYSYENDLLGVSIISD